MKIEVVDEDAPTQPAVPSTNPAGREGLCCDIPKACPQALPDDLACDAAMGEGACPSYAHTSVQ